MVRASLLKRLGRQSGGTRREGWLALLNALTLVALALVLWVQPGWSWPWAFVPVAASVALLVTLWWPGNHIAYEHVAPGGSLLDANVTPDASLLTTGVAPAMLALPAPATVVPPTVPAEDMGINAGLGTAVAAVATLVNLARDLTQALEGQREVLARLVPQRDAAARFGAFDPLTGLATHTTFMTRLSQDVAFASQQDRPLALAIFDLAEFRTINRCYGYPAGDEVLIAVAERLRLALDESDLVGRLGGDRFGVAWANLEHGAALARVEHVIHLVSRQPVTTSLLAKPVHMELRAGLAICPDDGLAAHALLEIAVDALASRRYPAPLRPTISPSKGPSPLSTGDQQADLAEPVDEPLAALPAALPSPQSYLQQLVQRHSGIHALTSALEARDPLSVARARNLAELAEETALRLGRPIEEARLVGLAVLLHDVGELGIAPEVLAKSEPLTPEEWSFVREHPRLGERLLKSVGGVLAAVAPMVASLRERWDGSGYPDNLAGEAIPLGARIVAICDVFGALISERPYRRPHTIDEALAEIARCSGTQFDPQVVAAFMQAAQA